MGLKGRIGKTWPCPGSRRDSTIVIKKLLVVAVLALSAFAVWRKVQADRAELDLWTAATTDDE
jgi:hypothetical protein